MPIQNKATDCKDTKFSEAITEYISWKSSYAPRAAKMYEPLLKKFGIFTNKPLERIEMGDIISFQLSQSLKYSKSTVAYGVMILRNFFDYWQGQGAKCLNPRYIRVPRYTQKAHETLKDEQYALIDELIPSNTFPSLTKKLAVRLLWDTGVRVSELCDLDINDIDLGTRSARILTKKSNIMRWVFWTPETHDTLVRYLGIRLCLNQRPALLIAETHNARDRVTTRTVQRWINELCTEAGIKTKISPHSFRHAKAHRILNKGGTVADIAKILGHSDKNPSAAFNYLRLSKTEIEDRARLYL